jgi:hypothetical protein
MQYKNMDYIKEAYMIHNILHKLLGKICSNVTLS